MPGQSESLGRCNARSGPRLAALSLGASASLLAAGCSPAGLINSLAADEGFRLSSGLSYGNGPRRQLDIYQPDDAEDAPVVVFFYGGSWQSGTRETYRFLGSALARRGVVAVVPDYRVYPEVKFPAFLEDGAEAVAWVKANARQFGGDPDRVVLMGHSAGAHIAAMLAIEGRWLDGVGLQSRQDIAGLIGLAGPYDFLPIRNRKLKLLFEGANRPETQPITFVEGGEPPTLLITGGRDTTVAPGNSRRLAARLREAGSEARLVVRPLLGHLSVIGALARPLNAVSPVLDTIDGFIDEVADRRPAELGGWPA